MGPRDLRENQDPPATETKRRRGKSEIGVGFKDTVVGGGGHGGGREAKQGLGQRGARVASGLNN
jgi:hypothetical protein